MVGVFFFFGIGDPRKRGDLDSRLCGRAEERAGSDRGHEHRRPRGTGLRGAQSPGWPSLARLSGRDGQVLWDVVLSDKLIDEQYGHSRDPQLGDLDGDGGTDAVVLLQSIAMPNRVSISFSRHRWRDGKRLWSRALRFERDNPSERCVGDLDGDRCGGSCGG